MPPWFVVSGLLACTGPASSEPAAGALQWRAPPQCPTAEQVTQRARALGPADLVARVGIDAVPGGFAARIEHRGRTHELRSASCDELATAVALLLAGVDAPSSEPPVDEPADDDPDATAPASVEVAVPPPAGAAIAGDRTAASRGRVTGPSPTPPVRRWPAHAVPPAILGPYALLAATAGVGLVPRVDVGGHGALGWSWTRVAIEIGAFGLAPMRRELDATTRATVMLAAASLQASARLRWGRVELRPGGAFEAGGSRVRAQGEVVRTRGSAPWLAARAQLRALVWAHPRIAVTAAVALIVPLLQTRYVVGDTVLFAGAPVGFAGTLGLTVPLAARGARAIAGSRDRTTRRPSQSVAPAR